MTRTAYITKDGRVPTTVLWSPALKTALRAEVERRNAERKQRGPRERPWGDATVSEDILRQVLGVGESE